MTKTNTVVVTKDMTKEERIAAYEANRKANGFKNDLFTLVKPATIKPAKDGAKVAVFRLAQYDKETKTTDYVTGTAYIKPEKVGGPLEDYLANLPKGEAVSVDYKEHEYQGRRCLNLFNIMDRGLLSDIIKKSKKANA